MKLFKIICNIRGSFLSKWYGIETEGHFYKEISPGAFYCPLCGDKVLSLANHNFISEYFVEIICHCLFEMRS